MAALPRPPQPPAAAASRRQALLAALALAGAPGAVRATGPLLQPWPAGRATPALQLPQLAPAVATGSTAASAGAAPAMAAPAVPAASAAPPTPWSLAAARGRPVLLNFWASWCEPCRAEMPSLQALAAQQPADGLLVLAVNFREGEAAIRRFQAATGLVLPVLRDADGAAAKAFGVRIYPSTVAIGRDGRARFTVVGEADWQAMPVSDWLAPLLQPATGPPLRR